MRRRAYNTPDQRGLTVPDHLLRFDMWAWVSPEEEEPASWVASDRPRWLQIQAHKRYRDAQRAWSAEHGVDYADTFHPEWRHHLEHRPTGGETDPNGGPAQRFPWSKP